MYPNILVATDMSPRSIKGIKKAIEFAHFFNSKIIILNVHEEFLNKDEMIMSRVSIDKLQNLYESISLKAKDKLKKIIHDLHGDDIQISIKLKQGKASKEILKVSIDNNCDLSITNNQLCPPYPSCIEDYVGDQDTSDCP